MVSYSSSGYTNDFFDLSGIYFNSTSQGGGSSSVDLDELDRRYLLKSGGDISNNLIINGSLDVKTSLTLPNIGNVEVAIEGKQPTINDGDLTIAKTDGLQTALDAKQDTINDDDLTIANTLGLQTALNALQPTINDDDLTIANTLGLQTALDAKQDTINDGDLTIAKTNGLQTALNALQPTINDGDLTIAKTNGLQGALNALQPTINDGDLTIAKTDGLQGALNAKQDNIISTTDLSCNTLNATTITGTSLVYGTTDVETVITSLQNNKQDNIISTTDLTSKSLTTNDLIINESLNIDNVITYEKYKQFDTLVMRRQDENDTRVLNPNEIQVFVNNDNILFPNPAGMTSYFAEWSAKSTPIASASGGGTELVYNNMIQFNDESLSAGGANALIIKNITPTFVDEIQAIIFYHRANGGSTSLTTGLIFELYNSVDDADLLVPLAVTPIITTANYLHRFDFPAITTYTNGFFDTAYQSTTLIPDTTKTGVSFYDITTLNTLDEVNIKANVDISGVLTCDTITLPIIGDVETAIQGKQATIGTDDLAITDTAGLQAALDAKQDEIQDGGLTIAKTSGLQTELDNKYDDTGGSITGSVNITGDLVVGTTNIITEIATKQDEITAGTNISIIDDVVSCDLVGSTNISITGNVISSTGLATTAELGTKQDELTAGTNISIVGNEVSCDLVGSTNISITGNVISSSGLATTTQLATKQDEITAGTNISIIDDVVSCDLTGSTNIDITGGVISTTGLQNELTAGTNISIVGDVVSCDLTGSTNIDITGGVISTTGLQDEITTSTDLSCNSLNTNQLIVNGLLFDTIVIRRPNGVSGASGPYSHIITLQELQCWVNNINILASNASILDASFALWSDKIGGRDSFNSLTTPDQIHDDIIIEGSEQNGAWSDTTNQSDISLIIKNIPKTSINNIQSLVLYNRTTQPLRAVGLAIELYYSLNDPNLETPLATTEENTTAEDVYCFDFPAIDTYPSGDFSDTNSITQIASETLALKEVVSDIAYSETNIITELGTKQPTITSATDLTSNSLTTNNLTINNSLSVDTRKYFDTIVLRRPTGITGEAGDFYIALRELQVWIGGSNVLQSSGLTSLFANWAVDKEVDLGALGGGSLNKTSKLYDNVISNEYDAHSKEDNSTADIALIIKGLSLTLIETIQALVLYNRTGEFNNTTIGLAIELYNSTQDPTFTEILATTNVITTAVNVYRFDFPDIATYTGFATGESLTNIILEEDATSEVVSVVGSPTEMEGGLSVDTITTTGNATIGGNLTITGKLTNTNQPCFKAVSGVSGQVPSGNPIKYNNEIIDNDNGYITTTGEYTIKTAGNWFFYYSFQSNGVAFKVQLQQNGVIRDQVSTNTTPTINTDLGCKGMAIIPCVLNDVIRVFVFSGSIRLENASQFHSFGGYLIG